MCFSLDVRLVSLFMVPVDIEIVVISAHKRFRRHRSIIFRRIFLGVVSFVYFLEVFIVSREALGSVSFGEDDY